MKLKSKYRIIIDGECKTKEQALSKGIAYKHICEICNREFYNNSSRGQVCKQCHIELQCKICKEFLKVVSNLHLYKEKEYLCKKCSDKINACKMNTPEMFKQRWKNNKETFLNNLHEGHKRAHTPEANRKRYESLVKSGKFEKFYKSGIEASLKPEVRKKQLESRKANGYYEGEGFKKVIEASHTPEAISKRQKTRKENGALDNWVKICHEIQKEYIRIVKDNEIDNPDYDKAKKYYDNMIKSASKGREVQQEYIKIFKNNDFNNPRYEKAKKFCESISENLLFDRESFYKDKISFIKIEKEEIINLSKIDKLHFPGVWSIWVEDSCIDVCQTKDVGSEILLFTRRLSNKFNSNIDTSSKSWDKKYEEYKNSKPIIKLVAKDIDELELRLKIEAQYAHDNKAKCWSPEPGQFEAILKYNSQK